MFALYMQNIQTENDFFGNRKKRSDVSSLIRTCFNFVLSVIAWECESLFLNISFSKQLVFTDEVFVTVSNVFPGIILDHSST